MTSGGRAYEYPDASPSHSYRYLRPCVESILSKCEQKAGHALDYGCGNGTWTRWLREKGYNAVGVDISETGISLAKSGYPENTFSTDISTAYLLKSRPFDLILCIEVIAHCFDPFAELEKLWNALRPGGLIILSTPYHGYLKNVAMAVTGRLDRHLAASWTGGYVAYYSRSTISKLLRKTGFENISVRQVGRVPPLAKSMVVAAWKPI